MKKYKEYMDSVAVSPDLHRRLTELEPPRRAPAWKRYGALAAALVLALGLGGYGLSHLDRDSGLSGPGWNPAAEIERVDGDRVIEPAVAPADRAPEWAEGRSTPSGGGYEVRDGEVAGYFFLPHIEYGQVAASASADWAPPVGVSRRDLTEAETLALLGGEASLTGHLDWGDYEVSAHALVYEDGSLWCLWVHGWADAMEHFELAVRPGSLPPVCIVYPESAVNDLWGVEVTADGHDGEHGSTRRISFMDGGYGVRFEITGADGDAISTRTARLARFLIIGDGLALEPGAEDAAPPDESGGDGSARTMPYDPAK